MKMIVEPMEFDTRGAMCSSRGSCGRSCQKH